MLYGNKIATNIATNKRLSIIICWVIANYVPIYNL